MAATRVWAQTPGKLPEFEVASIKPNKTNERMYYGMRNASLTVRNMTVMGLIQIAYGKRDFQISGGPAWIGLECFDIEAKAAKGHARYAEVASGQQIPFDASQGDERNFRLFAGCRTRRPQDEVIRRPERAGEGRPKNWARACWLVKAYRCM